MDRRQTRTLTFSDGKFDINKDDDELLMIVMQYLAYLLRAGVDFSLGTCAVINDTEKTVLLSMCACVLLN